MLDNTGNWCFEGGCSYMTEASIVENDPDFEELEMFYREPCLGMYD